MFLLGLGGIDKEILDISTCLPFTDLLGNIILLGILLNCAETHCLNDLLFLFTANLSQLAL